MMVRFWLLLLDFVPSVVVVSMGKEEDEELIARAWWVVLEWSSSISGTTIFMSWRRKTVTRY